MKLNSEIIKKIICESLNELQAYNGSCKDFKHFSNDAINSGTGAQQYGWGIYLTLDPKEARIYAQMSFERNGGTKILYTVNIPDDNGRMYIDWFNTNPEMLQYIYRKFGIYLSSYKNNRNLMNMLTQEFNSGAIRNYGQLYQFMIECRITPKEISEYLYNECYIKGNRIGNNYVMFNANDIQITGKQALQENVEEMQAYHGSNTPDIKKFNSNKTETNKFGHGIYVTINHDLAMCYGEDGYVYTVDIPDDNGNNYAEWNSALCEVLNKKQLKYLADLFFGRGLLKYANLFSNQRISFGQAYNEIIKTFPWQLYNKYLNKLGIVGVKGSMIGAPILCIFNGNDVKILNVQKTDSIVNENVNEIQVYHGSGADFSKFDHHFISTGCGSQCFGWGTYVTDDMAIGNSYAQNAQKPHITIHDKTTNDSDGVAIMTWLEEEVGLGTEEYFELGRKFQKCRYNPYDVLDTLKKEKDVYEKYRENADEYSLESINKSIAYKERHIKILQDALDSGVLKFEKAPGYLYEVDIPEDNGSNYIEWHEYFPPEFMKRVLEGLRRIRPKYLEHIAEKNYPFRAELYSYLTHPNFDRIIDILCKEDNYNTFFAQTFYSHKKEGTGGDVYRHLQGLFNSDKAASLFLSQCGFVGIKYETGTRWKKPDGASENGHNYVIFNPKNANIMNKKQLTEGMGRRVSYTAQVVDNPQELMSKYPSRLPNKYYHHSTNVFGKQPFDRREGEKMVLKIKGRFTNQYIDALVVENPNSKNDIPHITLATGHGIKPYQSNVELSKHPELIKPLNDTVATTFRNITK